MHRVLGLASALSLLAACALFRGNGPQTAPAVASSGAPDDSSQPVTGAVTTGTLPDGGLNAELAAAAEIPAVEEEESAEDEDAEDEAVAEEAETLEEGNPVPDGNLYTAELTDEVLAKKWKDDLPSLGSVSVGFVDQGRLINAKQFPQGQSWTLISPALAWATEETIEYIIAAADQVRAWHANAPPLRVNQLSTKEGGYLRPHKSHQNGRDVDLGFYYPSGNPVMVRAREKVIDVKLNWALVKALATLTDVQFILLDRRVQKVLYDYALASGEDKAWLDSLFRSGKNSLLKHARRHRDHFHVRFYNARAQELGRRVAPLLAQRPEQNITMHRVRRGDTLGAIARRYGSSVSMVQKANRMRGAFLKISQVLRVPMRGPCTRCPIPPAVALPPRRLPPGFQPPAKPASPAVATIPEVAPPAAAMNAPSPSQNPVGASQASEPAASPATASGSSGAAESAPTAASTAPSVPTGTLMEPERERAQPAPSPTGSTPAPATSPGASNPAAQLAPP